MANKPSSSRRKFLTTLGVGGAAAAAVALTPGGGQPEQSGGKTDTSQGKGYQLTEHVRNYYRNHQVYLAGAIMILTRKSSNVRAANRLSRGVSAHLGNMIDRRTFLRRSG